MKCGFYPKRQAVDTLNIYTGFQQARECCALYWYFGAKMAEEKKNGKIMARVITDFEHPVPCWRQKKFGTELDGD